MLHLDGDKRRINALKITACFFCLNILSFGSRAAVRCVLKEDSYATVRACFSLLTINPADLNDITNDLLPKRCSF